MGRRMVLFRGTAVLFGVIAGISLIGLGYLGCLWLVNRVADIES